jgi:hypothetical protein
LLKNGHQSRASRDYPAASPSRRRGKKSLLIRRDATPHPSEAPDKRDFAELNLHLPACRSLGAGRALFEQPGKEDFFGSLLDFSGDNGQIRGLNHFEPVIPAFHYSIIHVLLSSLTLQAFSEKISPERGSL